MANSGNFNEQLNNQLPFDSQVKDFSSLDTEQQARELRRSEGEKLKSRLKSCRVDSSSARTQAAKDFEDICFDIIKLTFEDEFQICTALKQQRTFKIGGEKVEIFDVSLLNAYKEDRKWLWQEIKERYDCQQILFECKHYSVKNKISDLEILQLYGYLSPNQLGRFGVILNKYGLNNLDDSAKTALRRVSQDKYLILVIGNKEMNEWIDEWVQTKSISRFFSKVYSAAKAFVSN